MRKFSKRLSNGEKLAGSMQMDIRFMVMKKIVLGVVCHCLGHITKMVAMAINSKKHKSSSEPEIL